MSSLKKNLLLIFILALAAFFRLYNINWDQGQHLHPDERAITITVVQLQYPHSLSEFLSPTSPWNPHFFAYGSFPFYILKIAGDIASWFNPVYSQYDNINLVGRVISAFCDVLVVFVIYKIGRKIFSHSIGLLAAFLYTISVLPIQLSHFYAVDTLLTLCILLTLYQLILFYEKPSYKRSILIGLFFGMALATKVSAVVLIVSIFTTLAADFFLILQKNLRRVHLLFPYILKFIQHLFLYTGCIILVTGMTYVLLEPYAIIDMENFWYQTNEQSAMTKSAFTFPYTLQYVYKLPYVYELQQIFLFGLGPILATLCFAGVVYVSYIAITKEKAFPWAKEIILLVFFFSYFVIVGKFAVGFMRYMLPLYPILAVCGAVLFERLLKYPMKNKQVKMFLSFFLACLLLLWPFSFMHTYTRDTTRVTATEWINKHIPANAGIGIEHWDDSLPLYGGEKYRVETLPLYDTDRYDKWKLIKQQLTDIDYIILASNRLYTPLQKLHDCTYLPLENCYPITAEYYNRLFSGNLGFTKVAEFTSYPTIPLTSRQIIDDTADESFTVYDHPKIIIFKKTDPTKLRNFYLLNCYSQ